MNDLSQIQCFYKYLGLTYSLSPTLKLAAALFLSVAVISVTVVADVYSVESSAYIDTLASQWHVVSKDLRFKSKGPRQLP